ncbi:peptidase [Methanobacterium sp.]|uniref:peptidase n=1 Tax=Methanobacterium sp. TaxID=2164 RepID=UPI0025E7FD24|nr:peptidase [Methanobacterium sp.]MBI5460400.1 PepSY domain-containing protein [Methanobacterium sp.]MDY9922366.1 peptidase [Methanobacterium sp.]
MDLGEGWEKKALIIVAVVVFILVVYAYNPFQSKTNVTSTNESYTPPVTSTPVNQTPVVSNNSSNLSSSSSNNTFLISADQAKNIAVSQNPGYKASEPFQGTIVVNQTTVVVWMVPISKFGQPSKTVYVDVNTGKVVNTT